MNQMNPQQAQKLLKGDFSTDIYVEWIGNAQLLAEDCYSDVFIKTTPGNIDLAESAWDLAEIVAGLHYEYAVQVDTNYEKLYVYIEWVNDEGILSLSKIPRLADWMPECKDAESLAEDAREQFNTTARVIRRLVSEPEEDVNEK